MFQLLKLCRTETNEFTALIDYDKWDGEWIRASRNFPTKNEASKWVSEAHKAYVISRIQNFLLEKNELVDNRRWAEPEERDTKVHNLSILIREFKNVNEYSRDFTAHLVLHCMSLFESVLPNQTYHRYTVNRQQLDNLRMTCAEIAYGLKPSSEE
jgi:hypothetical protein